MEVYSGPWVFICISYLVHPCDKARLYCLGHQAISVHFLSYLLMPFPCFPTVSPLLLSFHNFCDSQQLAHWKKSSLASLHSVAFLDWPGWCLFLGSFLLCLPLWKSERKISTWKWLCAWRQRTNGRLWETMRRGKLKDLLLCSIGWI